MSGDPNHAGIPTWPAYDTGGRATMLFNNEMQAVNDARGDIRRCWATSRA